MMEALAPFQAVRGRLFGLAYRMLGSRAEAEDVVQEAYVRWHQADQGAVENAEAWLVSAATRLAIDRLRRLKTEREAYVGPWLPQPLVGDVSSPERALELADDLSMAFLTLLEQLAPEERAAFLLHDVFDVGYSAIAPVLDRSEAACRQVVHRARQRVRGDQKRFEAPEAAKADLLRRFQSAMDARDEEAVLQLFAPDAIWTADGGGKVAASPRPIEGADPHRPPGGRAARAVLVGRAQHGARRGQRRAGHPRPRRRPPGRDALDRDRRRAHPRRLCRRQPRQAQLTTLSQPPSSPVFGVESRRSP